jgi:hypothetical protein
LGIENVYRAVTHYLIGNVDVAGLGVLCFWSFHTSLSPGAIRFTLIMVGNRYATAKAVFPLKWQLVMNHLQPYGGFRGYSCRLPVALGITALGHFSP